MDAKKPTERANKFEIEKRLCQVREWVAAGRRTWVIVADIVRLWGHTERSAYKYLRKASAQLSEGTSRTIREQRSRADAFYDWLAAYAVDHLESVTETQTVTETPGPDGTPVRTVTVVRKRSQSAAMFKGALAVQARKDKIGGLEAARPGGDEPIGIDVKWPVWSEGPGEGGEAGQGAEQVSEGLGASPPSPTLPHEGGGGNAGAEKAPPLTPDPSPQRGEGREAPRSRVCGSGAIRV